jgi:hypothetical protein
MELELKLSNMRTEQTFWDKYAPYIILGIILFVIVMISVIIVCAPEWKKKHFARTHRTVTLYGCKSLIIERNSRYSPDIPTMEGKSFGGWFLDTALTIPWKSADKVKYDIVLYPKWI